MGLPIGIARNANPHSLIKDMKVDVLIEIYFQINHLKQLFRKGWLRDGRVSMEQCESVADHTFGMLILAWFIIDKFSLNLDVLKVFKMIIAHEFGEVYGGDITPHDKISKEEKNEIERASVIKIFDNFPDGHLYVAIWEEFEAKISNESIFVSQIDKLEMAFQASVYTLQHQNDFTGFMKSAEKVLFDTQLVNLFSELQLMH